jgi:hypothetical protein
MEIMKKNRYRSVIELVLVSLTSSIVGGCASAVDIEANFPPPLIQPLPVRVGLIYDEQFVRYEYFEDLPRQASWTIFLGDANYLLLDGLFQSMFLEAYPVESVPLSAADLFRLDGVLQPELEKFEFDVPIGGNDEFVEVWMQYRLKLFEPDGDLVTDWPVSGYGKAELGNKEVALNRATVVAMREVGAAISTRFAELPQVEYWLQERRGEIALPSETTITN